MSSHLEHYHKKYRIIEEVVDIIAEVKEKSPQIQKARMGVLLKIVSILDKNANYHSLLLSNIH